MFFRFRLVVTLLLILAFYVACISPAEPPPPPDLSDDKAPTLTFENTDLYRARSFKLKGTVVDQNRLGPVRLFESGQLVASSDVSDRLSGTLQIDENGNWLATVSPQRTGEHSYKLEATDVLGNSSTISKILSVAESYNIVVLLTDDQHFDTLQYMPFVRDNLLPESLNFTDAFITIPVCCPARASLLSGFHGYNTGVLTNPPPNGSLENFNHEDSLPLHLQNLGYNTGFIGKYMHGYRPGFVPPGWTSFVANNEGGQVADWINLKDITIGSSGARAARGRITGRLKQHLISYHRDKSLEFIDSYSRQQEPFFLYISTYAPHPPATPEVADANKFLDFDYSARAFNETDLSDKPKWVQNAAETFGQCSDFTRRKHLQSLQGVDRMMEDVYKRVEEAGELDRTIFVLTSDNGLMWGEHGIPCDKGMAYEESIRVPFVVRMPNGQTGTSDLLTAINLDLATTLYDLVGFKHKTDGLSLMPVLQNESSETWRDYIPIESYSYLDWRYDTAGLWAGIRTKGWKYVETADDTNELYNLVDDPFELANLIANSTEQHLDVVTNMQSLLDKHRGLAITTFQLPDADRRQDYEATLTAWGGSEPYTWSIVKRQLPNGLSLDPLTGTISGIPSSRGNYSFRVRVTSPKQATHRGQNQQFFFDYDLRVN